MNKECQITGLSLFSSAGIAETYFRECGVDIVVSNELIQRRADLYKSLYPDCHVVCGDITDNDVFQDVISHSHGVDFIIASPPCQGMSICGKTRNSRDMLSDDRNFLIFSVFDAIKLLKPKYVMIENVSALLKIQLPYHGELMSVIEILLNEFSDDYEIDSRILDASDYGVPQVRNRAIIKMFPKGSSWKWPKQSNKKITVREAIGDLPSLESGETSNIKWHFARKHCSSHIEWMRHTPTNSSASDNPVHYPKKKDGTRIKCYNTSYRRIGWDEPSPTITIRNDAISSQKNVHPGRRLEDGTYSDARVLTPLELMILDSLPTDWAIPDDTPEILIRQVIGESIPPLMTKKIIGEIPCLQN